MNKRPVVLNGGRRRSSKLSGQNEEGLKRYWDLRSKDYIADTGIDPSVHRTVVEYLSREGIFLPGDTVLDVGCGPGTFSLLFAEGAKSVTGLDVSEGMLSMMMRSAKEAGKGNIRPVRSRWEAYGRTRRFDLVFSSFCPAIDDAETLRRMEERSRRSCCFVTSGDASRETPADRLWGILTGESVERNPSDALYLFDILYFSGRSPSLRSFKYDCRIAVPAERLTRHFIAYFEMFMELDERKKEKIKDYISSISKGGIYRNSATDTLSVVHWDVDGFAEPG